MTRPLNLFRPPMPLRFASRLDVFNPELRRPPTHLNLRRFPQFYPCFRDFVNFIDANRKRKLDFYMPFLGVYIF